MTLVPPADLVESDDAPSSLSLNTLQGLDGRLDPTETRFVSRGLFSSRFVCVAPPLLSLLGVRWGSPRVEFNRIGTLVSIMFAAFLDWPLRRASKGRAASRIVTTRVPRGLGPTPQARDAACRALWNRSARLCGLAIDDFL